jgi:hypothetical protein
MLIEAEAAERVVDGLVEFDLEAPTTRDAMVTELLHDAILFDDWYTLLRWTEVYDDTASYRKLTAVEASRLAALVEHN